MNPERLLNTQMMMMICDETIIKLMQTHHKHAKLHSCLNKLNLTLKICFLVVENIDTDIVGLRQHNILFWGILSAIFDLRVKVVPPLHQ